MVNVVVNKPVLSGVEDAPENLYVPFSAKFAGWIAPCMLTRSRLGSLHAGTPAAGQSPGLSSGARVLSVTVPVLLLTAIESRVAMPPAPKVETVPFTETGALPAAVQ